MTFTITLTASAAFLSVAAIVIFAIVVAGIRGEDRAKNLTRRLLGVGVRTSQAGDAAAIPPGAPSSSAFPESDLP